METRAEYEAFLTANCARFTETLGRYTAAMPKDEKDAFISIAIEKGFRDREHIAKATSGLRWWEDVCRSTASTKRHWLVIGTSGRQQIKSNRLGR